MNQAPSTVSPAINVHLARPDFINVSRFKCFVECVVALHAKSIKRCQAESRKLTMAKISKRIRLATLKHVQDSSLVLIKLAHTYSHIITLELF